MNSLIIFKSTYVNAMHSSISVNLEKYLYNDVWAMVPSQKNSHNMETGVSLTEALTLSNPNKEDLKDIENAIRLHKTLRILTPLQASDARLWTRLAHVEFWSYMRCRWPVERYLSNRDKMIRFIESRYFVSQAQSRALLRNGIARLWWTAQLSYDYDRDNPYELTSVLLSNLDITMQIVERNMGRVNNIIHGFLEFLLRNNQILLTGGDKNRTRIRLLVKHLNIVGGVCILDLLTKGEVMDILSKEFPRILEQENSDHIDKRLE